VPEDRFAERESVNSAVLLSERHVELPARPEGEAQAFRSAVSADAGNARRAHGRERATLKNPDFITEDEADLIYIDREPEEPTHSLDEVLAEAGIQRRRRSS
jgi:hypothetical protein